METLGIERAVYYHQILESPSHGMGVPLYEYGRREGGERPAAYSTALDTFPLEGMVGHRGR